jgi:hypothetical protein
MSKSNNTLNSKRFVLRQSLVGKDTTIVVTFKNGNTVAYSHDKAFTIMQKSLEAMPCWAKYKSYTASNNIPKVLRETDAVISRVTVGGSPVEEKSFA